MDKASWALRVAAAGLAAAPLAMVHAQAVNWGDPSTSQTIGKGIASWINYYFTFSEWKDYGGAWNQQILQWHESGIYFDTINTYMKWSGDYRYQDFVGSSFIYATHQSGDFTNGCIGSCGGTWNDDIGWWALAALSGGDVFGMTTPIKSTMLGEQGQTWLYTANYTLWLMYQQWDPSTCNGGIYWSRDRASNLVNIKFYKSAISNEEASVLGARIHIASGDREALRVAMETYDWTLKELVRMPDYYIYDGLYSTQDGCQVQDTSWSYHYGMQMQSGVLLNTITGNSKYLDDAVKFYTYWKTHFVKPDGTFFDYLCGTSVGSGNCKDPSGYEWPLYGGLAMLYNAISDTATKNEIKNLMVVQGDRLSARFGCNQATWNCIRTSGNLNPGSYVFPNGTSPRDQVEMLNYINGMVAINGAISQVSAPPEEAPAAVTTKKKKGGAVGGRGGFAVMTALVAAGVVGVVS